MQTVDALRGQVERVHIVDNGSDLSSIGLLRSLEKEPFISIDFLPENRGIGYALNRGVQRAREAGCTWLLTMDQDSVVDGSFVAAYRAALEREPEMVSLAPRITTRAREKDATGGEISYAITSGNLVRVSVFDRIGGYDEGFFVDCIDFDFCLRMRRAGYALHRVADARMSHQLGEKIEVPEVIGRRYARHSPVRRYYMYRNFLYLAERHFFKFPGFVAKLGISSLLLFFLIGFLDKEPLASYRAVARGVCDYVVHKTGPYTGPTL